MTFRKLAFKNATRNFPVFAPFFFSSTFSIFIFFVYALFTFHPDIQVEGSGSLYVVAASGMKAAQVILFMFAILFVFYSMGTFLQARQHEFAVLFIHGMTKQQFLNIVIIESCVIGLSSIITGVLLGLVFAKWFLLLLSTLMGIEPLRFYIPIKAIILTAVCFLLLFMINSLFATIFVKKNRLIHMLSRQIRQKNEPSSSKMISIGSFLLLIFAYYLAATANGDTIAYRMFPVIGMVVISTYFLFTQWSIFMIKLLKRKKRLLLKKTNLIFFSDLAFKLKDNARMFFLVSIISTVAFCAVGTLASLTAQTKYFEMNYPFAVGYANFHDQQLAAKHVGIIERDLIKENLPYKKVILQGKKIKSLNSGSIVTVLNVDRYNQAALLIGLKPLHLKNGEGMLVPPSIWYTNYLDSSVREIYLEGFNRPITLTGKTEGPIFPAFILGSNIIVVDSTVFNELPSTINEFIGFKVEDWKKTDKIGVSLHKEFDRQNGEIQENTFLFLSAGYNYMNEMKVYKMMIFIGVLVGAVFFITAGSFLYFRLYADLPEDQERFNILRHIGLAEKELKQIITKKTAALFYFPIAVAIIHSIFAFKALQSLHEVSIMKEITIVIAGFLTVHTIYYFFIRRVYYRKLLKGIQS
ncbi:FtsX-like permease family protein [Bacillus aquiflavi]|uniref:FtsX-like permease family protein n=1 Tax=Bacillus aquiflavi TaxID=2672567 RepID=A0A6B3VWX9_9BACI|nr:FtsX-like permease family protein [Bacillus aquiflavi]MBA4536419.1 FtsX-like permease family protein [Bacillus aquiflavi]NEY80787.1 FtsX-like permease family protein [Bacillus aquiflavi]